MTRNSHGLVIACDPEIEKTLRQLRLQGKHYQEEYSSSSSSSVNMAGNIQPRINLNNGDGHEEVNNNANNQRQGVNQNLNGNGRNANNGDDGRNINNEDNRRGVPLAEMYGPRFLADNERRIRPPPTDCDFAIPGHVLSYLEKHSFHGLANEDPNDHLDRFIMISDILETRGVPDDAKKMRLFPFSLESHALKWYKSLDPATVRTWDELKQEFLIQYFSPQKAFEAKNELYKFREELGETLAQAWTRFKELNKKCPQAALTRDH